MAQRTIIVILLVIAIVAVVVWAVQRNNDDSVSEDTLTSVSVFNQTKNGDATITGANPKDILVYTLTVQNNTDKVVSGYVVETNIGDLGELSTLTDAQGANYNASNNSLMWTPLDVPANGSIEKQFSVRVKDTLPTNSDLLMSVRFNNEVSVSVAQPVAVTPAPTPSNATDRPSSYQAPTTGPSLWFAFLLALTFTAGVVLYRAATKIKI